MFLYIETNKNAQLSPTKSNRAFSKSGLQVVYQLLTNELIINAPYRHIGKIAKVSIDTVGRVLKELLRDEYLVQMNAKELKLQNKEQLLQDWVTFFNKVLRPTLKQRNFKPKNFANISTLQTPVGSLGGELAGEILSNYLIAESAIIYTDASFIDTAKSLELLPSVDGSITLIEKFWVDENTNSEERTVHPVLVYADLLSNPTTRNLETAEIIYNKYVRNTL